MPIGHELEFPETIRLFPLPRLVFFPHVIQGLHIFEPRYRTMMADTLADDMLMALVCLKEGWDADYDGRPAIEEVACLGRVGVYETLADGRYNLRLHGLTRIRIDTELNTDKPYRIATATKLDDEAPDDLAEISHLRQMLADAVLPRFENDGEARKQLEGLFHSETPLGALADMLSYALPLPLDLKQQLLTEVNVAVRTEVLADALRVKTAVRDRKFPPDFSIN